MSAESFDGLLSEAKFAVQERDLVAAIHFYQQALVLSPDNESAHEGLATACFLAKDYDQAIEQFEIVTMLKHRDAKAFINLGALYNLKQDFKAASVVLRKAIQRNSKSADAYYNLGIAEKGQNQLPVAVSAYKECIKLKPEMAEAHQNLANCLVEQQQYKKAIEHYELALKHRPAFGSAQRGIQHVRALMAQQKDDASPFGRLVDTNKLDRQADAVTHCRELNEDERFDDRQFLTIESNELVEATEKLWTHLRDYLEPSLLKINRVLSQEADNRGALIDVAEDFHEAQRFATTIYDRLHASAEKLKQHERAMN